VPTGREKLGAIVSVNLFFGALLGTNLGTLGTLPLHDCGMPIVLLADTVVTIRLFSTSERCAYTSDLLAFHLALVAAILFVPDLQPKGLAEANSPPYRSNAAIWLAAMMIGEYSPPEESKA
jgi:hypothetical protein